jgi:peptidoglycan/xylan/chitin deacetylase (PgdA/CDA1 family)
MKKFFAISCLILSTLVIALFFWAPTQYVVPVMAYHSVDQTFEEPLNNVRPENFSRQMDFLKKQGYRVIPLPELVDGIKAGKAFAMNTVAICFDDGYLNNYTNAYPILKARGLPATIFIPSDNIGKPGRLTWDQVREMSANGITIGSHMRTEAYLPETHGARLISEIFDSKKAIEAQIGRTVDILAYPVGGYTEEAKQLVHQAGYTAAFSTNRGYKGTALDLYALKRVRIKDTDDDIVLKAKLSGYYNFFRRCRRSF